jgi:hypothetical protein
MPETLGMLKQIVHETYLVHRREQAVCGAAAVNWQQELQPFIESLIAQLEGDTLWV